MSRGAGSRPERATRVWRVSVPGRVGALVVALGLLSMGVVLLLALAQDSLGVGVLDVLVAVLIGATGVPILVAAYRSRIELTPTTIVVTNPIRRESLPLAEVKDVTPGWGGLSIEAADGTVLTAWAVQKSNLASWLSWRTRSDRVAAEIRRAARP